MLATTTTTPSVEPLSIETACREYTDSVKLTLTLINHQLDTALSKRFNELEELSVKIAARTHFLEKNPTFLSVLTYDKQDVNCEQIDEFNDIKITLQEHSKRILDKLDEVEEYHKKLLHLVTINGTDPTTPTITTPTLQDDDDFQDCLDNFDKIKMQKDAFSESSIIGCDPPFKHPNSDNVPADVQRGKPQEDLHGKLVQQIEAADSLEGFIKLMERRPQETHRIKTKKSPRELEEKYTGSLWFFPRTGKSNISRKTLKECTKSVTVKHESCSTASTCCNLLVTSSQPSPIANRERTKRSRLNLVARTRLRCYDLLDDIDGNDVKPIKSEYPRRDNIVPMKLDDAKTYLHRMMQENEKVWKKLLLPVDTKRKNDKKQSPRSPRVEKKSVRNLMEYLTAPQQKYLTHIPQSLIVMPVKIFYDNFPTKETVESPRGAVLITDLTKTMESRRNEGKALHKVAEACRSDPFPIQRKKEMLDQLRGLKLRNDSIQKHIQKAIDVIETKMIDLLSSPTNATSSEAFNAMEEEITNVLKMMNESEKVEAEKDVTKTSSKEKRVTNTKKSVLIDLKPEGGDQSVMKNEPKDNVKEENVIKTPIKNESGKILLKLESKIPRTIKDDSKISKELNSKKEKEKKSPKTEYEKIVIKKREGSTERVKKSLKTQEDGKKTANIEEGERLLGQVDSVIRKIDSIYTKFYDDSKTRVVPTKQETNYGRMVDIFDVLKQIVEPPPVSVTQKMLQGYANVFQQAHQYCQAKLYHKALLDFPLVDQNVETEDEFLESEQAVVITPQEQVQEIPKAKKYLTIIKEEDKCNEYAMQEDKRHEYTLKAFYTLFFSSIFVALNFDYAA